MFASKVGNAQLFNADELSKFSFSAVDGYDDGYATGLYWPDAWDKHGEPGGPWVYTHQTCSYCDDRFGRGKGCDRQITPRFTCREGRAYARESQETNRRWRQGWKAGIAEKRRSGLKNPLIGVGANQQLHNGG